MTIIPDLPATADYPPGWKGSIRILIDQYHLPLSTRPEARTAPQTGDLLGTEVQNTEAQQAAPADGALGTVTNTTDTTVTSPDSTSPNTVKPPKKPARRGDLQIK